MKKRLVFLTVAMGTLFNPNAHATGIPTIDVGSIAGITAQIAQGIQTFNQSVQFYQDNINQFKNSIDNQLKQIQQLGGITTQVAQFQRDLLKFQDQFKSANEQAQALFNSVIALPSNLVKNLTGEQAYDIMFKAKDFPDNRLKKDEKLPSYLSEIPSIKNYFDFCKRDLNEQKEHGYSYGYAFDYSNCINNTLVHFSTLTKTIRLGQAMTKYAHEVKKLSEKIQHAESVKEATDLQNQLGILTQTLKIRQQEILLHQEQLEAEVRFQKQQIDDLKKQAAVRAQFYLAKEKRRKVIGDGDRKSLWGD